MIKKLFFASAFTVLTFNLNAQIIEEPEFIGECILIRSDNTVTPLEKQLSQERTAASTGLILTGIGKVRQQIQIDGCCANVTFKKNEDVTIIARNTDNASDPLSVIKIFKFESKKKYRRADLASVSSLGSAKSNNLEYISFSGKKYGESSYSLKLSNITPGEYAVIIVNPNALDQKQTVVSTFAVTN